MLAVVHCCGLNVGPPLFSCSPVEILSVTRLCTGVVASQGTPVAGAQSAGCTLLLERESWVSTVAVSPYPDTTGDLVVFQTKPRGRVACYRPSHSKQADSSRMLQTGGGSPSILSAAFVVHVEAWNAVNVLTRTEDINRCTPGCRLWYQFRRKAPNRLGH